MLEAFVCLGKTAINTVGAEIFLTSDGVIHWNMFLVAAESGKDRADGIARFREFEVSSVLVPTHTRLLLATLARISLRTPCRLRVRRRVYKSGCRALPMHRRHPCWQLVDPCIDMKP